MVEFFYRCCVPFFFLAAQGWVVVQLVELNRLKSDLKRETRRD